MKWFLALFILNSVAFSLQKEAFTDLPALNPYHHVEIKELYLSEIGCLQRLDKHLKSRWTTVLNKIPTIVQGNMDDFSWQEKDSSYTRFNTFEEEWLMNDNKPVKRIEQCFRDLVIDVVPLMSKSEVKCLNKLFETHILNEIQHQHEFERVLKPASKEQLPFRKFITFNELIEMLFQNRSPDAMTDLERVLYEHAEGYLVNEEDKARRTYTGTMDCEWRNARALREVSGEREKFDEFKSQVLRTVNKQLAGELVKNCKLNASISNDRHERWLKARQTMAVELEDEISNLRKQRKDVQWLCEYATKLAFKFSQQQLEILMVDDKSSINFESSDVASMAREVENTLAKLKDFRHGAAKMLADEYEKGTRCMFSILHLIQNHRKYDFGTAFINERYSYPELYCSGETTNFGLVQMYFCNCVGSFCVAHPLAALFSDEYAIAQDSKGGYQVVRSGRKSKRKITHCHVLANANKFL